MNSDGTDQRSARLRLSVAVHTLLLVALGAATAHWADTPRALTLCAIAAVILVSSGYRSLMRLGASAALTTPDPDFGSATDAAASHSAFRALEAQLEYAPVAIWRADLDGVQPLNNAARRLLAPGRAVNEADLRALLENAPADRRTLVGFDSERGHERALLASGSLELAGVRSRLLALMPIESELETETLMAWRQLVQVLTHEIMNSLTPIASLSRTAQELLAETADARGGELDIALDAIARRAAHLVTFVDSYRRVSEVPPPQREAVALQALFARLEQLVGAQWRGRGGTARFSVEPATLELLGDAGQLEQALLNLIKNAAEATIDQAHPALEVHAHLLRGERLAIEVRDNGPGVAVGLETSIFTPFFSTREHGSGIGLALVRSLVHGMGGTIRYAKRPLGGACFVIAF